MVERGISSCVEIIFSYHLYAYFFHNCVLFGREDFEFHGKNIMMRSCDLVPPYLVLRLVTCMVPSGEQNNIWDISSILVGLK